VKRLLVTGGGTAGHVVPALPVIEALIGQGVTVDFVGSGSDFERELLAGLPVAYHGIPAGKLRRYFSLENLVDAFRVIGGIARAFVLLGDLRPDVVFSKGGFVSFPVVFAAWLRRIPVVAHESDLTPGLANRLAMPFVTTLCVNFPVTRPERFDGEILYTGTPVREALLAGDADRGRALIRAPAGKQVIVITGGSLGADRINEVVRDALDELLARAVVVHVCGRGKTREIDRAGYHQFEYVGEQWGDLLAAADLVVSRAGANTLYELLCLKKPNLLIPLSAAASRGDQIENAEYAKACGYSRVIQEAELDSAALVAAVDEILGRADCGKIAAFTPPDSVTLIVDALARASAARRR
jgi:UDP-N-acetylglucosamine--N-acetylmuramyl-(pentapeptide) pyrophosphoryl-undecaprenol N-acetylglucosamine transferase